MFCKLCQKYNMSTKICGNIVSILEKNEGKLASATNRASGKGSEKQSCNNGGLVSGAKHTQCFNEL